MRRQCGTRLLYSRSKRAILSHGTAPQRRQTYAVKQKSSATQSPAKGSRQGRRTLHYVLLLVGTVLIVDGLVGEKGLLAMLQARAEHTALEESLADIRAENARLREEARRLREDPDAIEDLARSELGLIRPGERLFIIKDVAPRELR